MTDARGGSKTEGLQCLTQCQRDTEKEGNARENDGGEKERDRERER